MPEFFEYIFLSNSILDYLLTIIGLGLGGMFILILSPVISSTFTHLFFHKWIKGEELNKLKKLLNTPIKATLYLIVLFFSFNHLVWPEEWSLDPNEPFGLIVITRKCFSVLFIYTMTFFVVTLIKGAGLIFMERARKTTSKMDDQLIPFLLDMIKVFVWFIFLLVVLKSVFNINVTSLVEGLGIGGLAVALAAQDTLANLFGSFTIFLDKPFLVGDMVKVNGITGVVEKVGFRSTRLRTLEKSYVTLPNKKMIEAELDNLTLRTFRRVDFNVGLTYETSAVTIKKIVEEIQAYIDNHQKTNMDGKVKFMSFGSSSLDIMVLYFIDTMDWDVFLDVKEEINYKIMEIVEHQKSSFAFPSTTVYLDKN